jgi:hypothetical protein
MAKVTSKYPGQLVVEQSRESRLHSFDQATERHRKRQSANAAGRPLDRGWTRDDIYKRGRSR